MSNLDRFQALIIALRDGPLALPELVQRLGATYPAHSESRRVMLSRDIQNLHDILGIVITKTNTRPPIYTLLGGTPHFTDENLRALALFRDSFGPRHPEFAKVQQFLDVVTGRLSEVQRQVFTTRQSSNAPLNPAIDYTPHAATIARIEQAISQREVISFAYQNTRGQKCTHSAEPYEVEYYEHHFYMVGYHHETRQVIDYRIDRIKDIASVHTLPPHLSRTHERTGVRFRYRLAAILASNGISQRFENQCVVERLANGDAIIEADGRSDFFVVRTLLKYAGNAEILEPAWLREKMREEVRKIAALYEDVSLSLVEDGR